MPLLAFLLTTAGRLAAAVEAPRQSAGTQVAQRSDLSQNAIALPLEGFDVWQIFHTGSSLSLLYQT